MRKTFVKSLLAASVLDEKILLMTGDLGYSVLEEYRSELPNQFLNLGIAEQSLMSVAAGVASEGFRPFVYSIGNFPTLRCLEQIRNDVCAHQLPVTIVSLGAGFSYGTAGYSHHLVEDLSILSTLAIDIYAPHGPQETELSIEQILKKNSPAYLRLGRGNETNFDFATSEEIKSRATEKSLEKDLFLLFAGTVGDIVSEIKTNLDQKGIEGVYVSCFDFTKLDKEFFESIPRNIPIFTLEENVLRGGFGTLIAERISPSHTILRKFGIQKIDFSVAGSRSYLLQKYGLSPTLICREILSRLAEYRRDT